MEKWKLIFRELTRHIPFTILGAITGIIIMVVIVYCKPPREISSALFYTLHPAHVILSAMTTTAMYRLRGKGAIWKAIIIGYTGSIGIATLSDAVIPYLGGTLLNVSMEFHLPFIETEISPLFGIAEWQLVKESSRDFSGGVAKNDNNYDDNPGNRPQNGERDVTGKFFDYQLPVFHFGYRLVSYILFTWVGQTSSP